MKICEIKAFKGRSIYSHKKVVKLTVDLEEWADIPTKDIGHFNENLLKILPGLKEHHCSVGKPGGFVMRLNEGTYLAHVIEHCALEIQNMLGYNVSFGRARQIESSSRYYIVYEYINEVTGLEVGRFTVRLMESLCGGRLVDIKPDIEAIKKRAMKSELGPSSKAIMDAAIERGIPVIRIGDGSILQLGYGKYQKRMEPPLLTIQVVFR